MSGELIETFYGDYGTKEQLEELILYKRIISATENKITLDNGAVITVELSDSDCCAGGGGSFEFPAYGDIEGVITDIKIHEPIDVPDSDTRVRRNTITFLYNGYPLVNANAEADAGNGGYYFAVVSLVINDIHFPFVDA